MTVPAPKIPLPFRFDRTLSPMEQAVKVFHSMEPAEMILTYRTRYAALYDGEIPRFEYVSRLQMTGMFRALLTVEAILEQAAA